MLPFDGNLTAALAALAVAQTAQLHGVYTDVDLIALHDKVFHVTNTPACYVGDCSVAARKLYTKKELKANVLRGDIADFNATAASIPPYLAAYYLSCRDAAFGLVYGNTSFAKASNAKVTKAIKAVSVHCNAKDVVDTCIAGYKATDNMRTTLQYRIQYLLEDVKTLYVAAQKALNPSKAEKDAAGSGFILPP